jgi:hypothetical protein
MLGKLLPWANISNTNASMNNTLINAAALHALLRDAGRTFILAPGDRHGPLPPILLVLTFVTGIVDAVSFLRLGHVFVANMTGNTVFIGFGLAGATTLSVPSSLVAIGTFLLGAAPAGWLCKRLFANRGHLLTVVTTLECLFLFGALVAALVAQSIQSVHFALHAAASGALVLALLLTFSVALVSYRLSRPRPAWCEPVT